MMHEPALDVEQSELRSVCQHCLSWAEDRDFNGYDPYDGLNSPLVSGLAFNWLSRLVGIHLVNKLPVNVRPLLGVPRERNPKGIALFTTAYLNLYEETRDSEYLEQAERLLGWLLDSQCSKYDLPGWGYNFDWQNGKKFFLPAYEPSIVVTVFCGNAFRRHYDVTGREESLAVARNAGRFIRQEINAYEHDGHRVFSYTPHDSFVVINANALAADFFYQLARRGSSSRFRDRATDLFEFVVDAQTDDGAWYYAMPASESHLSHDNFHTGFVLESLYDYAMEQAASSRHRRAYERGLAFYRRNLFEPNGAPKFEHDTPQPYDAHAAAQAIITFAQSGSDKDAAMAEKVYRWSVRNLLDESGYFYRRIGRLFRDETPYIRWSQAWMCRALSELLLATDAE